MAGGPTRYGSYELVDRIGRGGMGEVWRARHVLMGRAAAVKVIRAEMLSAADPGLAAQVLRRFEREVKATSALRSPHTISVYDFGVTDEGTFYYAMELLEGMNLQALVQRHGPVPPGRAIHLLAQACDSLAEAHHHGLIHRDVKPANLYACTLGLRHDFVKVLDFGLVKSAATAGESQLTLEGSALGSPAFMPPEVAQGGRVDGRSDLYAVGCVAYWLLTGRLVFEAETAVQMVLRHVQAEPVPLSRAAPGPVPPELEAIVMSALSKRPDERPGDAAELAERLRAVPVDEPWTEARAKAWWVERDNTAQFQLSALRAAATAPPAATVPAPVAPAASTTGPEAPEGPGDVPAEGEAPAGDAPAPGAADSRPRANPDLRRTLRERPVAKEVLASGRERTIAELQEQFVLSRIDATELGRRIKLAEGAASTGELEELVADLPELPGQARPAAPSPRSQALERAGSPAPPTPAGTAAPAVGRKNLVAVFGERTVTGPWQPPPEVAALSLFGNMQVDLRSARLPAGRTTIRAAAVFGRVEIVVPADVWVDVEGVGIFGAFHQAPSQAEPPPTADTPWIRVTGAAVFGEVTVGTRPTARTALGRAEPPRALPPADPRR